MTSRLIRLTNQRDLIEQQLGTAAGYIELEVRGRRVKRDAAIKTLEYINDQITQLERKAENARGPARNRVRLVR